MKWLLAPLLALALAGCADRGNVDLETPIMPVAQTGHILSMTKEVAPKSLTARAQASKIDAKKSTKSSSLMECVSDACKTECSPEIKRQSRPKWCMYFRESIDKYAVSATAQRKSTE